MQEYCIKTSSNIRFGYLLESPYYGDSKKISKTYILWENKNKTRSFLHIILSIKDSLQQQIHFNGNIFGKKCCHCNEGSLYITINTQESLYKIIHNGMVLDIPQFKDGCKKFCIQTKPTGCVEKWSLTLLFSYLEKTIVYTLNPSISADGLTFHLF